MTIRHGVRVGAAAFALGLALAGPQAASLALADGGDADDSAVSSGTDDARGGAAKAGRSAGQARSARVAQREAAGSAREGAAPARASATDRTDGPAAGGSPVDVGDGSAAPAPETRVTVRSQRPSTPGSASRAGAGRGSQGRAPAVPVTDAADAVVTGGAPPAAQVPIIRPGIPPSGEATMTATPDPVQDVQATIFNALANFLINLPHNDVTTFLEGALLMVRQRFFNQAPRVTPSPQTTSEDGTVIGRLGAFDFEDDALSYTVTGEPQHGTVKVDETGVYTYAPDLTNPGSDSFTVRISPATRSWNVFNWASDGSREVTISIGGPTVHDAPDVAVNLSGATGRLAIGRDLFGQINGTVTVTNLTDDTQALWMDTAGGFGGTTVKEIAENYVAFKAKAAISGATVDLHLVYVDTDDVQRAIVLDNVEVNVGDAGSYVFTGRLAPSPEIQESEVDTWDVTGKGFKSLYDDFRAVYNLESGRLSRFQPVEIDFTGADLYVDTITPFSYEAAGLYAQDSESRPAGTPSPVPAAPAPAALTSSPYASLTAARARISPVNVSLAVGQSVYIGRENGTVEVWTVGNPEKQVLAGLTSDGKPPWGGGWADQDKGKAVVEVTTLTRYDRVLKDEAGQPLPSSFTGYIRGNELTVTGLGAGSTVQVGSVISGPGVAAGTIITAFVPRTVSQANCSATTNTCGAGAAGGGVEGLTGTYRVSLSQTVGESVSPPEVPAGVVFNQATLSGDVIPAVAPAVLVGLSNGSIQMYSPSVSTAGVGTGGWTELHGFESDWGGVKAVMPYLDGFVVGLDNGYVRKWIGPTTNAATGSNAYDPGTWRKNWEVLYRPGTTPSPKYDGANMPAFNASAAVTVMMPFRDRPDICPGGSGKGACNGFLVGRADGSVLKYNEGAGGVGKPGWETLYEGNQNSPVVGIVEYKKLINGNSYLPSFAFALRNGYVGEWKWEPKDDGGTTQQRKYGVERIQAQNNWGKGNEITAITQLDRGFAVGLATSSVQLRDAASDKWIELHDNGWLQGVTALIPFSSDAVTGSGRQGVIAGLRNGSLQAWTGGLTESTGQNHWIELHDSGWGSAVRAIAPAAGSAVNIYGDAVTRDGLIIGFANGSVQQWSGTVTRGAPLGYISNGKTQPAVFTGSISGNTLTVTQVESGNIASDAYVVGGPQNNTEISPNLLCNNERCTGTGGAGTYAVYPPQTWPSGGGNGMLTAGRGGSTLILELPAAYLATSGGLDPASLVGSTVTGTNVAAGTKVTKYLGRENLPAGQAAYEVNTFNLVGSGPLTLSGLPKTGQRDWTELEAAPASAAQGVLGSWPSLSDFTCDASWRCTQSGPLQEAVDFGKGLAAKGSPWSGSTSLFGTKEGVGSTADPIFGDRLLYPYPDSGTTYTLAFRKEFSPSALNYVVGGSDPIEFKGSVSLSSNCGAGGTAQCAILTVNSVTTKNKTLTDIKEGMTLEPGTFYKFAGLTSTTIGKAVTGATGQFYIDGFVPNTDIGANIDNRLATMSVAATSPLLKLGIDVNPLGYGYVVVPDGFFPKFKPGRWSLGVLLATEIGPSLRVQAEVEAPEKDFQLASIRTPGPLGFDSFILSAGARLGANVSVNGLGDKTSAVAYAYAVPGLLVTYNSKGEPGELNWAFNYYLDANASDFKSVTGVNAKATLTPYINLLYGILIPPSIPIVGGWSLFSIGGGFENPITAVLCVDASLACPTPGSKDGGANASLTFGSSGALTFRAGLLDGITSALTYEKRIPLYQIPDYTTVLA